MITFKCDKCGRGFEVPDKYSGRAVSCKDCGNSITVPLPDRKEVAGFNTTLEPYDMFMDRNYQLLRELLEYEQTAPGIEAEG